MCLGSAGEEAAYTSFLLKKESLKGRKGFFFFLFNFFLKKLFSFFLSLWCYFSDSDVNSDPLSLYYPPSLDYIRIVFPPTITTTH